ncbi:hypothetical protein EW15_1214 [Prochlorococcus sp. MIT 0801]|nr:hypothetical protein EW15_1214 [Prochlorococcus sp. MIT 0801]
MEHSVSQKLATLPPSKRLIIVSNSLILSLAISIFQGHLIKFLSSFDFPRY